MNETLKKKPAKPGSRFYYPDRLGNGAEVRLPEDTGHHAVRSLRLGVGDPVVLFDGHGGEYGASISRIERGLVTVKTETFVDRSAEAPLELVLAQGLSSGERMDFTIQKAVELGVGTIIPVITQRSVVRLDVTRRARRLDHWRGVAIHASQQCGRTRVPAVSSPLGLDEWLGENAGRGHRLGFVLTPEAARSLDEVEAVSGPVALLIGPEGGLSEEEQALAVRSGMQPLALGPRILRTETAALAAITALQLRWGDLSVASR
jgi:16S rRNA (uracil1498-N3)-methyltransferase